MKTITRQEWQHGFRDPVLDGVKSLRITKYAKLISTVREVDPETEKPIKLVSTTEMGENTEVLTFSLKKVTPEEVADYRRNGVSSFVLKVDGELYHTEIPNNISFLNSSLLGVHLCAKLNEECSRLSAASDENGGCEKVRTHSKKIEEFPWITKGFQTFNTKFNSFRVVECSHYEKCPKHEKLSITEKRKRKLAIAQYVWPEIKTLSESAARIAKNLDNSWY